MLTEVEQEMAALIEKGLAEGLLHPGDPENGVPETPVMLPFQTKGRPEEYTNLVTKTMKLISEAIIYTMRTQGDVELVKRTEARTLRLAADEAGPMMMPIYCRCDAKLENPLTVITVQDPARVVIDARALLRGLKARETDCPHNVIEP